MRLLQSSSGARNAPPRPFSRAAEQSAGAPVFSQIPALRGNLNRHLSVLLLRARLALAFDPARWTERTSAATATVLHWVGQAVDQLSWQAVRAAIRAIEWRRVALVASEPFVLPTELRAAIVRILAYLAAIGAMSLVAAEFFKEQQTIAEIEAPIRPAWTEVEKPWPAFQLEIPGFSEEDFRYGLRRHAEGGGRKDILSFGELGRTQRFMSFEIYRPGREIEALGRPADEVRALAAEYGRVTGLHSALPIPSKFGKLQAFEFAIGPFNSYNCVGFVRNFDTQRVQIGGLSCSMNLLVDRTAISCALDRLTLMSAGSDPGIARLFAKAELNRSFCGARDHLFYATPKRPGSEPTLAAEAKPRLRGRFVR